jgi:hypothetical protein
VPAVGGDVEGEPVPRRISGKVLAQWLERLLVIQRYQGRLSLDGGPISGKR